MASSLNTLIDTPLNQTNTVRMTPNGEQLGKTYSNITTTTLPSQHTQNTCANIIEDELSDHLQQPLITDEIPTKTQALTTDTKHRLTPSRYKYHESWTHGLIIEHPDQYSLDTDKYRPNVPEWRTAWKTYSTITTTTLHPLGSALNFPFRLKHRHQKPQDNTENYDARLSGNSIEKLRTSTITCHRPSTTSRKSRDEETNGHNDKHKLSETPNKTKIEKDSGNRPRPKQ